MARSFRFSSQPALDDAIRERDEASRVLGQRCDELDEAQTRLDQLLVARDAFEVDLSRTFSAAQCAVDDPVILAAHGTVHRELARTLIAWQTACAEQEIATQWARDRVDFQRKAVGNASARAQTLEHLRATEEHRFQLDRDRQFETERDEASIAAWQNRRREKGGDALR